MGIDIRQFQELNRKRGQRWHQGDLMQWSLLEWAGAMAGEAGEACNAAKKIRRLNLNMPNMEKGIPKSDLQALKDKVAYEAADTIIYAMLLMSCVEADAETTITAVFNQKSLEYGFPEVINVSGE